jgi:hypothetical protein
MMKNIMAKCNENQWVNGEIQLADLTTCICRPHEHLSIVCLKVLLKQILERLNHKPPNMKKLTAIALTILPLILVFSCRKAEMATEKIENTEILSDPGAPPCYYPNVGVSVLAGNGVPSHTDGPIKTAGINSPMAMTSFNDNTYFSTWGRLRRIQGGMISTIYTHYHGPIGEYFITSLATDYDGNIYAAFANEYVVRKISPSGVVLATYGVSGTSGYSNTAPFLFNQISGIAVDADGRLYIADKNYVVRRLNTDGTLQLIAGQVGLWGSTDGSIAVARFGISMGEIAVSPFGESIFVEDNTRVRIINAGTVSTIAGSTYTGHVDGNGPSARFGYLSDMVLDASGNLYLSEYYNGPTAEYCYIRKIIRMTTGLIPWKVTTLAGGAIGYANGDGAVARFDHPWGITVNNSSSTVLVADKGNNRIRKLSLTCVPTF